MAPFKQKSYCDSRFNNSASIKNTLPILVLDLSYEALKIQDGSSTQRQWTASALDGNDSENKEVILNNLHKYCHLNTLAMVEIWRALIKAV